MCMMESCCPEKVLKTCLTMGSSKLIPHFALLEYEAFALTIKLYLSQPVTFLTFTHLILFLILLWEQEQAALLCLALYWG